MKPSKQPQDEIKKLHKHIISALNKYATEAAKNQIVYGEAFYNLDGETIRIKTSGHPSSQRVDVYSKPVIRRNSGI